MSTQPLHGARPIDDRRLPVADAAVRVGYAPETLRKMMVRGQGEPPPLFKSRGRWYVWLSELDVWAVQEGIPLHPMPDKNDEAAAS